MPRERASLAASMASIDRGMLSGSEWTWISTTPFSVCAAAVTATSRRLLHQIIDLLDHPDIILRLSIVRQQPVDLLLHVRQLCVAKSGERANLGHRLV